MGPVVSPSSPSLPLTDKWGPHHPHLWLSLPPWLGLHRTNPSTDQVPPLLPPVKTRTIRCDRLSFPAYPLNTVMPRSALFGLYWRSDPSSLHHSSAPSLPDKRWSSTATAHCFHLAPRRAPYPAPANSASTATAMADPGLSSRSPSINSHHPHSFLPRPRRSIPRLLHHSLQEIYGRNASRHAHRSSIAACTSILIGHHHRLLPAPKNSTREFSVASSTPSTTHHRASATGAPLLPPSMRPPLSGTLFCPGAQKQRRVLLPHRLISNV